MEMLDETGQADLRLSEVIKENGAKAFAGTNVVKDEQNIERFNHVQSSSEEDPFSPYGFGVTAYFHLLRVLILNFGLISLIMLPVMLLYKSGGNFTGFQL